MHFRFYRNGTLINPYAPNVATERRVSRNVAFFRPDLCSRCSYALQPREIRQNAALRGDITLLGPDFTEDETTRKSLNRDLY